MHTLDGIAKYTQLSLSTVGTFKLNLTLGRGSLQSLTQLTASFDVKPAALVATNSSIAGVYTLGDILGTVIIAVGIKSMLADAVYRIRSRSSSQRVPSPRVQVTIM